MNYINDFFIFLLKVDPQVVDRILTDLQNENKCGKAPELAKKFIKEMRKGDTLKRLSKVNKEDLFSTLLTASNQTLLNLITDLVKELALSKDKKCRRISQNGGAGAKKRSISKKRSVPKKQRIPKKRSVVKNKRSAAKKKRSAPKKQSVKKRSPCFKDKVAQVMGEFKRGKLKTSSGIKVKTRSQAIAIALSMGDRYC